MKKDSVKGEIKVLGIDLSKQSFQLYMLFRQTQNLRKRRHLNAFGPDIDFVLRQLSTRTPSLDSFSSDLGFP